MEFRKYEKIHRLGKEETDGILDAPVHVQEKIDGANLQIWLQDGVIHVGSRNNDVTDRVDGFNGAVFYVQNHEGIKKLLTEYPYFQLYGEWLVKHTVQYKETAYGKFYLFDIYSAYIDMDFVEQGFFPTHEVNKIANDYNIEAPHYYGVFDIKTKSDLDQLHTLVGKSMLGNKGEGVVIKRPDFRNRFGDITYAKLVSQEFMEDNAVVFGGNNKYSDTYREMWAVNKYMTLGRVQKICNKIESETFERLDMKHIPRIMETAYYDMFTEEMWEIAGKASAAFDFKKFRQLAYKKAKQIYVDILSDSISVADRK
jgi:hypothetical protein